MTDIEVIEIIKERIALIESNYPDVTDYKEALENSVKALEKQIPKKLIDTCQFVSGCCPNCKKYISNWLEYDKFMCCPYCGQRLNFERE